MALFDEVKDTLSTAGSATASKAKEIAEVTKLNNAISAEERKIKDAIVAMGEKYYEVHHDNPEPDFADFIIQIDNSKDLIEQKKMEIKIAKGIRVCPGCGIDITDEESMFCNKCGTKLG